MNTHSKVLLSIAGVVALVIGAALNSPRLESDISPTSLLNAELFSQHGLDPTQRQPVIVSSALGELTLINFWAAWCRPCREEMPLFEALYRQHQGFQVLGIAIDNPANTQEMLASMDITYPILYAEKTGNLLMESVGNVEGLLPYSLLLDKNGELLEQVLGKLSEQQISTWINKYR